jgi:TusE/DsrC/DsvC family sulfur relay protein
MKPVDFCHDPSRRREGFPYEVDDMGFLGSPDRWDRGFVDWLASEEEISFVSPAHWSLIEYARSFFLQNGNSPTPPQYARHSGTSVKRIHDLFPKGLMSVHRLAGLPQPKSC